MAFIRNLILLIAMFALMRSAIGCELPFKALGVCAKIEWKTTPVVAYETMAFDLVMTDLSPSHPVADAVMAQVKNLELKIWMDHGHHSMSADYSLLWPSPRLVSVTDVYFSMEGEWKIDLSLSRLENNQEVLYTSSTKINL